jgi:hypothetical protein
MLDQDFIAAKLRTRIDRRRQLGYRNVPVSISDLEYLIEIAAPTRVAGRQSDSSLSLIMVVLDADGLGVRASAGSDASV